MVFICKMKIIWSTSEILERLNEIRHKKHSALTPGPLEEAHMENIVSQFSTIDTGVR